uniref:SAP30-binding protein n=1 Tax=Strigamia maritima TaxID=126957 RepID=T1JGY9_STRMM
MSDSNPSSVLANLTATYTDSDVSDDEFQSSKATKATKAKKQSTLVSYSYVDDADKDEIADEIDEESSSYLVIKKEKIPTPIKEEKIVDDIKHVVSETIASKYEDFDVIMPPEPSGKCSPKLQEKIARLYEKKVKEGVDMNALIQNRKDFRNPSIYEKLISFCGIDEYGTNFGRDFPFGPESYYEELAEAQKVEMDKRQKERTERTKVEFVSGTKKTSSITVAPVSRSSGDTTTTTTTTTKNTDENKKRKSKWDVGSSQSVITPSVTNKPLLANPPGIVPVSTTASGNKATVISAFGTITKKAKQ